MSAMQKPFFLTSVIFSFALFKIISRNKRKNAAKGKVI